MGKEGLNRIFGREDWRPLAEPPAPSSIALDDSVSRVLEAAVGIADRVSPLSQIGVRHVLAALLAPTPAARIGEWLHDRTAGGFDIELAGLAPELLRFVEETRTHGRLRCLAPAAGSAAWRSRRPLDLLRALWP